MAPSDKVYLRRELSNVEGNVFRKNTRMTVTQMYGDSFGCYVNLVGGDARDLSGVKAEDVSMTPVPDDPPADPYAEL